MTLDTDDDTTPILRGHSLANCGRQQRPDARRAYARANYPLFWKEALASVPHDRYTITRARAEAKRLAALAYDEMQQSKDFNS